MTISVKRHGDLGSNTGFAFKCKRRRQMTGFGSDLVYDFWTPPPLLSILYMALRPHDQLYLCVKNEMVYKIDSRGGGMMFMKTIVTQTINNDPLIDL